METKHRSDTMTDLKSELRKARENQKRQRDELTTAQGQADDARRALRKSPLAKALRSARKRVNDRTKEFTRATDALTAIIDEGLDGTTGLPLVDAVRTNGQRNGEIYDPDLGRMVPVIKPPNTNSFRDQNAAALAVEPAVEAFHREAEEQAERRATQNPPARPGRKAI